LTAVRLELYCFPRGTTCSKRALTLGKAHRSQYQFMTTKLLELSAATTYRDGASSWVRSWRCLAVRHTCGFESLQTIAGSAAIHSRTHSHAVQSAVRLLRAAIVNSRPKLTHLRAPRSDPPRVRSRHPSIPCPPSFGRPLEVARRNWPEPCPDDLRGRPGLGDRSLRDTREVGERCLRVGDDGDPLVTREGHAGSVVDRESGLKVALAERTRSPASRSITQACVECGSRGLHRTP
jgi:hypothetical protein